MIMTLMVHRSFMGWLPQELVGLGLLSAFLSPLRDLFINPRSFSPLALVALSAVPVFLIGLAEDLTKRVSVKNRLIVVFTSGLLMAYFMEIDSFRLDFPIVDWIMIYPVAAILFLAFASSGLSNAYNIIDGFHGLASMVAIISATAILYIAFKVQDQLVISLSFAIIGSVIGFFFWNYPKGLIFLGDGGAYFIGFLIATGSILLVERNPAVSPWFALLVNAYPTIETLFTIWRRLNRKGQEGGGIGLPDGLHLHSLIYRRVMRRINHDGKPNQLCNAKTSPYLWVLSSFGVVPAMIWWESTGVLMLITFLYVSFYLFAYFKIVNFQSRIVIPFYQSRPHQINRV